MRPNIYAKEDAPDAVQQKRWKEKLHIDFDYWEILLAMSEDRKQPSTFRVFPNLQHDATVLLHLPTMAADGDHMHVSYEQGELGREKVETFPTYYFATYAFFNCVNPAKGIQHTPFNTYVVDFREGTVSFSFIRSNRSPARCVSCRHTPDSCLSSSNSIFSLPPRRFISLNAPIVPPLRHRLRPTEDHRP
jgi:hypothetical protein